MESTVNDLFEKAKNHGVNCVHLSSGEDIIGEVFEDETQGVIVVRKPVIPHVQFDQQQGRFRVGLLPLRPYLTEIEAVPVPPDKIIYIVPVDKSTDKAYHEFISNIVIVPANAMPPTSQSPIIQA